MDTCKPFIGYRATSESMIADQCSFYEDKAYLNSCLNNGGNINLVLHPELNFIDSDKSLTQEDLHKKSRLVLAQFLRDGSFVKDTFPSYYLYKMKNAEYEQLGLVCLVPIKLYKENRLIKHEKYHSSMVNDLAAYFNISATQVCPAMLAYDNPKLSDLVVQISQRVDPVHTYATRIEHILWRVDNKAFVEAISKTLSSIKTFSIIDGHHRLEALRRTEAKNPEDDTHVLAVLLPKQSAQFEPYHRLLSFHGSVNSDCLLSILHAQGFREVDLNESLVDEPQVLYAYYNNRIFKRNYQEDGELPVVVLHENILPSLQENAGKFTLRYRTQGQLRVDTLPNDGSILFKLPKMCNNKDLFFDCKAVNLPPKTTCSLLKPANGLIMFTRT